MQATDSAGASSENGNLECANMLSYVEKILLFVMITACVDGFEAYTDVSVVFYDCSKVVWGVHDESLTFLSARNGLTGEFK